MNGSIIRPLIWKDLRLNRLLISASTAAGAVALLMVEFGGETARLLGAVWFFVALIVLGSMLPGTAILSERKKQTLAFIMSLPVSSVQYTIAKIISIWAMFLVPWGALLIASSVVIETGKLIPRGAIPMFLILGMLPLIGFCITSATAMVGESEGWMIAANIACNSSYWFVWYLLSRTPSLAANWSRPKAVWNPTTFLVLAAEAGSILLILAVTLFIQSRKRDFI
jgi:ABC-2 type transport system permease protein